METEESNLNDIEMEEVRQDESGDDEDGSGSDKSSNAEEGVYMPGQPIGEDEELVCDESAYVMLHQAHTGAPCLSFDIIPDSLGSNRSDAFPLTAYIVAGTQAAQAHTNNLIVMKMSNLHRTGQSGNADDDDDDDEESDAEDESEKAEKKPRMDCAVIRHQGCVNRIRSAKVGKEILAASWSELGRVNIWKLGRLIDAVDESSANVGNKNFRTEINADPMYTFTGHQQEGFAVDWSPISHGTLATGDCRRDIHIWQPAEGGKWNVDQRPLVGHSASVEDLQWSPNEQSVLASCSVDKSIRIWDCRAAPHKACMLTCPTAHDGDVNVISWNRNEPFIASGGDDGVLNVWDLRQFEKGKPVATFKHHTNYITSVEWHPTDSTVFASGGADDQVAFWDLAVEKDDDVTDKSATKDVSNLPPQLLFIHQGQQDVKELHWHPQMPGVVLSTAHSGFNIFRTISI